MRKDRRRERTSAAEEYGVFGLPHLRSAIGERGRQGRQVTGRRDEAFDAAGEDHLQVVAEIELVEEEAGEQGGGIVVGSEL